MLQSIPNTSVILAETNATTREESEREMSYQICLGCGNSVCTCKPTHPAAEADGMMEWSICWPVSPGMAWVEGSPPDFSNPNLATSVAVIDRSSYERVVAEREALRECSNNKTDEIAKERARSAKLIEALRGIKESTNCSYSHLVAGNAIAEWEGSK